MPNEHGLSFLEEGLYAFVMIDALAGDCLITTLERERLGQINFHTVCDPLPQQAV